MGKSHIGIDPASKKFYEYDPSSDAWNSIPDFPGEARHGAVAFVVNGKAYVGLGKASGQPAYYSDFYEYDPVLNQWDTTKIDFPGGDRADAIAFTLNGKGYVGYGESQSPTGPVIDFWEFTPPSSWVSKVAINNSFVHSIGVSSGGNGYLIGGNTIAPTNENGKRVWMYNSASQQWTQKTSAPNFLVRAIGFESDRDILEIFNLADEINGHNWVLFTMSNCPACVEQKNILGNHSDNIIIVTCDDSQHSYDLCRSNNIQRVPTWVNIKTNQRVEGYQTLENIEVMLNE